MDSDGCKYNWTDDIFTFHIVGLALSQPTTSTQSKRTATDKIINKRPEIILSLSQPKQQIPESIQYQQHICHSSII